MEIVKTIAAFFFLVIVVYLDLRREWKSHHQHNCHCHDKHLTKQKFSDNIQPMNETNNQGGSLSRPVGGRSASVQCFRCEKFFRLPIQAPGVDPFPVQCAHCGYAHTTHDAKSANWPTI